MASRERYLGTSVHEELPNDLAPPLTSAQEITKPMSPSANLLSLILLTATLWFEDTMAKFTGPNTLFRRTGLSLSQAQFSKGYLKFLTYWPLYPESGSRCEYAGAHEHGIYKTKCSLPPTFSRHTQLSVKYPLHQCVIRVSQKFLWCCKSANLGNVGCEYWVP